MIDKQQLREYIIRPALQPVGLWSPEAEELLMGTAAHESKLGTFVIQRGGGPALGIWQVEPHTHIDIWLNYLSYRPALASKLLGRITRDPRDMVHDARHACVMARLVYLRAPEKLPRADLLDSQARYWKRYYNTIQGKGTEQAYIDDYNRFVA